MSLHPKSTYVVPDQTAQVARAIFPKGNAVMRLFDDLHMVVEDRDFADLFPARGRPAEAPVRLALATLLQLMEGLTDRQAADAVRTRIDWKYLLCLKLTDTGFDHTVLSEFRTRLLAHGAEHRLFDAVLELARGRGLLKAGGRQRSDSTHVLGAMRTMSRMEVVAETLRHALDVLATTAPVWLRARTAPAWVDRYGLRASEFRWPKGDAARRAWAVQPGADGFALLALARADNAPSAVRGVPALEMLRQVWVQNFIVEHGPEGPRIDWRTNDQIPPSGRYIGSPYDAEARYATKGATVWSGYKVHLPETCDDTTPNLITNVETTPAAVSDDAVTSTIHAALDARVLLPATHVADTGFVNLGAVRRGARALRCRPDRPDARRSAVAGQGRRWARRSGLRRRLRPGTGDVSSREDEPELDARTRARHDPGHQDQVRRRRLPGVRPSTALYALDIRAPGDHGPPRSAARSATRRTRARGDRGLRGGIRAARGYRRHHRAGRTLVRPPPDALFRPREDPPRPPHDSGGDERRAAAALDHGRPEGDHACLRVRWTAPGRCGLNETVERIRHQYQSAGESEIPGRYMSLWCVDVGTRLRWRTPPAVRPRGSRRKKAEAGAPP